MYIDPTQNPERLTDAVCFANLVSRNKLCRTYFVHILKFHEIAKKAKQLLLVHKTANIRFVHFAKISRTECCPNPKCAGYQTVPLNTKTKSRRSIFRPKQLFAIPLLFVQQPFIPLTWSPSNSPLYSQLFGYRALL